MCICDIGFVSNGILLGRNALTGTIPSCLGTVTGMFLSLENNELSGTIPATIGSIDHPEDFSEFLLESVKSAEKSD